MAKLLAAAGQNAPEVKYIFEINPEHTLINKWLMKQMKKLLITGLSI